MNGNQRKVSRFLRASILLYHLQFSVPATAASSPSGEQVFKQYCSVCHRMGSGTRAPLPSVLHQLQRETILRALETGVMRAQGSQLTETERRAVADFLGKPNVTTSHPRADACAHPTPLSRHAAFWNGWGVNPANSNRRHQTARAAGFSRQDIPRLKVKWAFGFPGVSYVFSQPTFFGGRIFVGSDSGTVYSLDQHTGCVAWTYTAASSVRTSVVVDPKASIAVFGDVSGNVYAVNAATGKFLWKVQAAPGHPSAKITGSPVIAGGRAYVPVSSGEEGWAANPHYACCTFRGSVLALDVKSGRKIWKAYTIPEKPRRIGSTMLNVPIYGPSGAAVWSTPTIDLKRRLIYVGTGNNYTDPPTPYSDAVLAFAMDSGKMVWHRQLTPHDVFNLSCLKKDKVNCPPRPGDDYDFGSSPILCNLPDGRCLLVIGQKSGIVHALDADARGKVVWQRRISKGGPLGGIEWGGAAAGRSVFFPISDWKDSDPEAGGGLFALAAATGKLLWKVPPVKPDCLKLPGCSPAQDAPPSVIAGAVFTGSMDGHLRAYDAHTGALIWDYNTRRQYKTVNGVPAKGGALNDFGATAAGGMLFLNAGFGPLSGNVLLAFSVDGK